MIKNLLIAFGILVGFTQVSEAMICNGSPDLCTRRYNECTYATTHNAQSDRKNLLFSFLPGSNISNQDRSISRQLDDGIRAMKIPVHLEESEAFACHGLRSAVKDIIKAKLCSHVSFLEDSCKKFVNHLQPCTFDPAAQKLESLLSKIELFLKRNANEVVTLFIEDYTDDFHYLNQLFEKTKLTHYMHQQNPNREWPTLQKMIDQDRRLVVFINHDSDKNGKNLDEYSGFNHQSHFIWGSKYHFETSEELEGDTASSSSDIGFPLLVKASPPFNKLWVLQHFITPTLGGSETEASHVNQASVLRKRVHKYEQLTGAKPNFIWVDFYELPDHNSGIFKVVNELNGIIQDVFPYRS